MLESSRHQRSLKQPELKDDCKDLLSWIRFKPLDTRLWTSKWHSPILISNKVRLSLPLCITYLIRGHSFQTPTAKCEIHNLYSGCTVCDQTLQKTPKLSSVDSGHYLNGGMLGTSIGLSNIRQPEAFYALKESRQTERKCKMNQSIRMLNNGLADYYDLGGSLSLLWLSEVDLRGHMEDEI